MCISAADGVRAGRFCLGFAPDHTHPGLRPQSIKPVTLSAHIHRRTPGTRSSSENKINHQYKLFNHSKGPWFSLLPPWPVHTTDTRERACAWARRTWTRPGPTRTLEVRFQGVWMCVLSCECVCVCVCVHIHTVGVLMCEPVSECV